ncbi:MAG TPA: cohesin domain-containing protein [Acidobacteriaceae bacterium]
MKYSVSIRSGGGALLWRRPRCRFAALARVCGRVLGFQAVAAALLFTFCVVAPARAHAQSANKLYSMGRAAEARDDVEEAYEDYAKAWHKKPKDEHFKISYERLRLDAAAAHVKHGERLRDQGDDTGALTEFLRALEIDPSNELAAQDIRATRQRIDKEAIVPTPEVVMSPGERRALADLGGPPQLKPVSSEPVTLHAVEDSKVVYQTVGKAAGINVLFDPDYHSTRVQVDLTNVSIYDALRILGTITTTFWRPITSNTIFVATNSRGKRSELDEEAVQTFYLTNVAQQNDLNDIQTALRNVFTTAKLYGVPSQNAIIMRGTPDELLLAEKLINDLDKARAEVVVDVAVMEVSRTLERTIGIQLPQTGGVSFQSSNANATTAGSTPAAGGSNTSTTGLTLNSLAHLNSSNFAVTIGSAAVNLLLSDTNTKILQNPRLRASDNQKSSLKIGERLPVATGSYQAGVATAITSSLVNTQFTYLDVGVNIDMTPTVHYDRDVSLKIKIEVSSTNGNSNLGGINEPIITQRTVDQVIRLREGEASILSGILEHQNSKSVNGTPGLGELPILKYMFSSRDTTDTDDEIVFLLIPHVVRAADITPLNLRQLDTGTTNSIELRHLHAMQEEDAAPAGAATTIPNLAPSGSMTGAAAGGSAGAATNALAGMQQQQAAGATPVGLQLTPAELNQAVGSTFKVALNLTGGADVYSSWSQMTYDATKLSLINVDVGELLGKDGQPVALVHRDDGGGNVSISASRPPGVAGVNGSGTVCTLTFQAKAPGDASVAITRPVVRNSKQQALDAAGSQQVVHIR